jgi:uncharacterized protein (TIGR00730 family)
VSDDELRRLLQQVGARRNKDILLDILRSALGLASDDADRLDLKITASAVREMREAFLAFAPHRGVPKVTIFGSARVRSDDPLYAQARDVASSLASRGWMVVTGAGPGIMAAGFEGAGRDQAIGVSIRLPFEEGVSDASVVATNVAMKYFFTRKLMLIKESSGFVCLPGGFGTQDETFELCTLLQTGKSIPAPVVLLDVPGGTYWRHWAGFVRNELGAAGMISQEDEQLFLVTDDAEAAAREIEGFWRNYDSIRWAGDRLVIRLRAQPTEEEVESLNREFGDLLVSGRIEPTGPLASETSTSDKVDLPRLLLHLDPRRAGGLRRLVDALNRLGSAPADSHVPATPGDPTT